MPASSSAALVKGILDTFMTHATREEKETLRKSLGPDHRKFLSSLLLQEDAQSGDGCMKETAVTHKVYALWVDPTIGLQGYIYALVDDPHHPGTKCASMFCSVEKFLMGSDDSLRRGWKRGKQSGKFADLYFPTRRSNECFFRLSPTGKKVPNWAGPVTATYAPQGSCYTSPSSQYIPLSVRFQLGTREVE